MKSIKAAVAGTVVAALAGAGMLLGAASASAAAPGYEPDPNASNGSISFYDAAGNHITGGTDLTHLYDYALASTAATRSTTKAQTTFGFPDHTKTDSTLWFQAQASAATTYPDATAPGTLGTATFPLAHAGAAEANLGTLLGTTTLDTTAGYVNLVQVRLKDSGIGIGNGVLASPFWATDIMFNKTLNAWSQVYPAAPMFDYLSPITPSVATPAPHGTTVTLSSTLNVVDGTHPAGSVHLFDGATDKGLATYTAATGAISKADVPADGDHSYTFVFTPADSSNTGYTSATSAALAYHVNPPAPAQDTKTLLSGATTGTTGLSQPIHADVELVSDSSHLPAASGTVQFSVDGSNVGSPVSLTATGADFAYTPTDAVPHTIKGSFTPANPALYNASADAVGVTVTATAPAYTPDPQDFTVTVPAGTLVISTPYTAAHPFNLGTLALSADGTTFATAPVPFGTAAAAAGTDPGNLDANPTASVTNGVTITDTRANSGGWTASAQTTNFSQGPNSIDGDNLSFAGVTPKYLPTNHLQAGDVITNDIAAFKTVGKSFAHTTKGPGTVNVYGFMSLTAPTSAVAGLYTATVTFTIL